MCQINCSGGCPNCAPEDHMEDFVTYAFSSESPWIDWRSAIEDFIERSFKEEWSIKAARDWYDNWKRNLSL